MQIANNFSVLILVLMEDTHWDVPYYTKRFYSVLILVLMEDTHWAKRNLLNDDKARS